MRVSSPTRRVACIRRRLVLGVIINGLSRTGGPLCRPESLLQGHAAWHVLSAASLAGLGEASPA